MSDASTFSSVGWHWRRYQVRFLTDGSRKRAMLKARQIGLSETLMYDGAQEALTTRKRDVYFVSVNFSSSKELLRGALKWIKIAHLLSPLLAKSAPIVRESATTVELGNGSRIIALPCRPGAVRGKTGSIYLDECDHYLNPRELWKAIAPAISSNPKLRITLSTTPLGQRGLLYSIFEEGKDDGWSLHKVDVHDAIRDGHPESVLELKADYTEEDWAQEFECAFVGDSDRYFGHDWMRRCWSAEPVLEGASTIGMDVGRINDRSAYSEILRVDDRAGLGRWDLLSRGMDHVAQFEHMREVIDETEPQRVIVDARGEGSGLADFLAHHYGRQMVQRLSVTEGYYQEAIPALKRAGEQGRLFLPRDPRLVGAFGKISKQLSVSGKQMWRARRDGQGHADLFYATLYAWADSYAAPVAKGADELRSAKATHAGLKRLKRF